MSDGEFQPGGHNAFVDDVKADDIEPVLDAIRSGQYEVTAEDESVTIGAVLGRGGTKTVVDAELHGERFALALPNTTDTAERAAEKWSAVMREPQNTAMVRDMGIPTNPLCDVVPVHVNGHSLNALVMKPYDETGFEVLDRKNPQSSAVDGDILPEAVDAQNIAGVLSPALQDVATLLRNGVRLQRDSFNLCRVDGSLRLYLNDLGSTEVEPFPADEIPAYAQGYVANIVGTLVNCLGEAEWQKHGQFLDGPEMRVFGDDNAAFNALVQTVLEGVEAT